MFATEIDVASPRAEEVPFGKQLDLQSQERPTLLSYFDKKGDNEFKGMLGKLIQDTTLDAENLESEILRKMKLQNGSRGWNRATGVKMAPMKVLIN